MKETGIVRRIDELGRVVIPKELRKVLKLKEGELLEIFTNESGELVFKKYNEVGATPEQLDAISKVLYKNTGKLRHKQYFGARWRSRGLAGRRYKRRTLRCA